MTSAHLAASFEEIGLDAAGWCRLLRRSDTHTVFQSLEWMRSWWSTFHGSYDPLFVIACDEAGVAGLAPLVVKTTGGGKRVVRFLGNGRADYCDILAGRDPERFLGAILDAIFATRWDVIDLGNVPEGSRTLGLARQICRARGYRTLVEEQFVCRALVIDGAEDEARRIHNKASLRRRENYLRRNGELVCLHLSTLREIAPYLDTFFEQHVRRWKGTKNPSLFVDHRNREFYRQLTANMAAVGSILFSVVQFDGEPVAFHYGFDYGNVVTWYKPAFDVAYASKSPGLVLVRQLIGYALERGRHELDFTVGDEPFKVRFTNSRRTTHRFRVFREPLAYALAQSQRLIARLARTRLREAAPGK